ncbi:MAG: penicillin-binding protein 2 [Bacillota bacterium]
MNRPRIIVILAAAALGFALLAAKLGEIQIVMGKMLAESAYRQRTVEIPVGPERGRILDRYGRDLTDSTVAVASLDLASFRVSDVLTDPEQVRLRASSSSLLVPKIIRYGENSLARHLVGYINLVDNSGVSGIEKVFDSLLAPDGSHRKLVVSADARGYVIPGLGYSVVEGKSCSDLVLTIDKDIQQIVEEVMDSRIQAGAVVVMDPWTGEVLALASRPEFDQNDVLPYLDAAGSPMLNRALIGFYPGSLFKVVVATAALEEGLLHEGSQFLCTGSIEVQGLRFGCYKPDGHGVISLSHAMAYSCNPVFIEIGQIIGAEQLMKYCQAFGLGERTYMGLPGETSGNLPRHEQIVPRMLANISIGQDPLTVTPVQMAQVISALANGGMLIRARVVEEARQGNKLVQKMPIPASERIMSEGTAATVRSMLSGVTRFGTGTAAYMHGQGAGKTGTAETGVVSADGNRLTYSWFAGFFPVGAPRYVMVVLDEQGMSGSVSAAPVFAEIAERILSIR